MPIHLSQLAVSECAGENHIAAVGYMIPQVNLIRFDDESDRRARLIVKDGLFLHQLHFPDIALFAEIDFVAVGGPDGEAAVVIYC